MERSLECFTGRNWTANLRVFNRQASTRRFNRARKAQVLFRKLRGDAEAAIEHLTDIESEDFDVLVGALNKYYNPTIRRDMQQEILSDRKIGPGESHGDYAAALRKLAEEAYPEETSEARVERNRAQLKAFLRGFGHGPMRVYVIDKKPTSLAEAVTWAEQWMSLTEPEPVGLVAAVASDPTTGPPVQKKDSVSTTPVTDEKARNSRNWQRRGVKREGPSLYEMVKQIMEKDQGFGKFTPKPASTMVCWKCNKQGHLKRDCDQLKRFVAAEGQILTSCECACTCPHEWLSSGTLN